jgi:urocanate hydratase
MIDVADWALLNAMAMCSSQADLVAIHSRYATSAGVTAIADGMREAEERLNLSMT